MANMKLPEEVPCCAPMRSTDEDPVDVELEGLLTVMHRLAEETYWRFFRAEVGSNCHAFLEFNGLLGKYVELCSRAAKKGLDFRSWNEHNDNAGMKDVLEEHDVRYLAQKLRCIFGPVFDARPDLAQVLVAELLGENSASAEAALKEE